MELSDVTYEEYSKSSDKISLANFETKQSVIKPPMELILFIQISEHNFERDYYCKNKTKITLTDQYSVSFPGIDS